MEPHYPIFIVDPDDDVVKICKFYTNKLDEGSSSETVSSHPKVEGISQTSPTIIVPHISILTN